ncbi:MAG: hypothetical protein JNM71_01735 [Flavobacterium lindanitolerans]|uniref:hypothetical protein n=1 Tax=Flavobacterium lindanitolerans TaxID=428988 RepID=UPI001A460C7C|nr:hypothetical protein [Flavobacterium lindanitolerans]MBL7866718.1 hypothetical protein [Flavobacterium lindanitolerans]
MDKKSLIDINTDLLSEYNEIKVLNPDTWEIGEYLNLKYDMNAAIAFSKLYFPDFIEKDGCIILGHRYNEQVFKQWQDYFNGDVKAIESMCNSYEVMDYFQNNRPVTESLDFYNQVIDELAKTLKKSWEINCQILFPDKKIVVEVYDEYDATRITLYQDK